MAKPDKGIAALTGVGAVGVVIFCSRYISRALATGQVPGKLGAVYSAPDFHYYVFTGFAGLGFVLGLVLLVMAVRWLK